MEVVTSLVITTPPVATGRQDVYAALSIQNALSQTLVTSTTAVFYTEVCPVAGQLGKGVTCRSCPTGAECPGGERIWPLEGYWTPGEDSGFVVACEPKAACRGKQDAVIAACAAGYKGERCGECVESFYRSGGICIECPPTANRLIYIICDCAVWISFAIAACLITNRVALSYLFLCVRSLQSVAGVGSMASGNMPPGG